jgi:plastocyanin
VHRNVSLALLLVIGLVATGCDRAGDRLANVSDRDFVVVAGERANHHGTKDVRSASRGLPSDFVEFKLDNFYFAPTILTGVAGQNLSLAIFNEGEGSHTFTIDASGVDTDIGPGGRREVEVTFPEFGALLFYCRFHAARGMRGGLSVGGDLRPYP